MLDLTSVDRFIQTIEPHPDLPPVEIRLHQSAHIAVETRYLARLGAMGILPFAGYIGGDQLALQAVPDKPLAEWPVVRVSHIGEGSRTVSSRLSRLMAVILQTDHPFQHQQTLIDEQDRLLAFSDWLGDTEGITWAFIEQSADERISELPHLPFSSADPDSVLALFDSLYGQAINELTQSVDIWRQLTTMDAFFAPAQYLLFKALLATDDDFAIRQSAWDVMLLNHGVDNIDSVEHSRNPQIGWGSSSPVIFAAQTLLDRGMLDAAEGFTEIFIPVIEALASDEDAYDGAAHLQAAQQLFAQQRYQDAYVACQNALYWRNVAQETVYPEALTLALTIARAWKQPELTRTLELAQAVEVAVQTQPVAPVIDVNLSRDIEWSVSARRIANMLSAADLAWVNGNRILIYRYQRWNYFTVDYLGSTNSISTMAVLHEQKLANLILTTPYEQVEKETKSLLDLSPELQHELRYKLLTDANDYHYLFEMKLMIITGGATTVDITTPQLALEKQRELTEKILTQGRGGWFKFWATGAEIEKAFTERAKG